MSIIRKIVLLVLAGGIVLYGSTFFTKNSSSEIAGIMDQLNPLVKEGTLYVKTEKPQSVNEYGTAAYQQTAADENGKTRPIAFNGLSELKVDRYLKLTNKGAHIENYEEVTREQVPEKALQQIDK